MNTSVLSSCSDVTRLLIWLGSVITVLFDGLITWSPKKFASNVVDCSTVNAVSVPVNLWISETFCFNIFNAVSGAAVATVSFSASNLSSLTLRLWRATLLGLGIV